MTETVLVLMGYYLPGFKAGGPIRSMEGLVNSLGEDFQFKILTRDRDLGDRMPYPCVVAHRWGRAGDTDVMYLRPGWSGLFRMIALLHSIDQETVLYLNSFFSVRFSILAILMSWIGLSRPRRVVLAPRGEFSPGAMILKRKRKRLYLKLTALLGIYRGVLWHASTPLEKADILGTFPSLSPLPCVCVPHADKRTRLDSGHSLIATAKDIHLISKLGVGSKRPKSPGRIRSAFVSRISPMKNLLFALRMLQGVSGDVSFNIYGPLEDVGYWRQCEQVIRSLPPNVRVEYLGMIEHDRVAQVFAEHDLFLFPTLGENYGHVICEALSAGCPVLTSDQTPWRDLEDKGVGWDIPLAEVGRFRSVFQKCVDADSNWYSTLVARAIEYARVAISDPAIIEENRRLFRFAFATQGKV